MAYQMRGSGRKSKEDIMLKRKKVKPITLRDVTIIDDGKLRKAITAASLGNAMEWFDFGVYGFVAYALGKVFFPMPTPVCK
jgi:MHS family proline/betaine transporter-like MFS transporter